MKVDHHPAGGHWFAAGLSPNVSKLVIFVHLVVLIHKIYHVVDLLPQLYLIDYVAGSCRLQVETELHSGTAHIFRFYHMRMQAVMVVWEALAATMMVQYLEAAMEAMVMPITGLHFILPLVHQQ